MSIYNGFMVVGVFKPFIMLIKEAIFRTEVGRGACVKSYSNIYGCKMQTTATDNLIQDLALNFLDTPKLLYNCQNEVIIHFILSLVNIAGRICPCIDIDVTTSQSGHKTSHT